MVLFWDFIALISLVVFRDYSWAGLRQIADDIKSSSWSCDKDDDIHIIKNTTYIEDEYSCNDYYSRRYRTSTGICNNLDYPLDGSIGQHFLRLGDKSYYPNKNNISLLEPNPYLIAKELLHYKPNISIEENEENIIENQNMIYLAWMQFIVHDMVGHEINDYEDNPIQIRMDESTNPSYLFLPRQKVSNNSDSECVYTQFKNTRSAWFDASQLYGVTDELQSKLMNHTDTRYFALEYIDEYNEYQLPFDYSTNEYIVGETGNFWPGLNVFHLLFALEHNYIIDALDSLYPNLPHKDQYHIARLIISAIIAKIHIHEFLIVLGNVDFMTHYVYENKFLNEYFNNIYLEKAGHNYPFRFDLFIKLTDLILDKGKEHIPYSKTEMFDALYTLHNIFTENICFAHYEDALDEYNDEYPVECIPLNSTFFHENVRELNDEYSMKDILYSFGTLNHATKSQLNSYPPSFTEFKLPNGAVIDLSTLDLIRFRERGLPKYTTMRKLLGLEEITSYEQLTDDAEVIAKLNSFYASIEEMDLLIGMWLENGDYDVAKTRNSFIIAEIQAESALRSALFQLKNDRFFTSDFNVNTYTEFGLDYVAVTMLRDIIIRHYPELEDLINVRFAMHTWNLTQISDFVPDNLMTGTDLNKLNNISTDTQFAEIVKIIFDHSIDEYTMVQDDINDLLNVFAQFFGIDLNFTSIINKNISNLLYD
eukprot:388153_1